MRTVSQAEVYVLLDLMIVGESKHRNDFIVELFGEVNDETVKIFIARKCKAFKQFNEKHFSYVDKIITRII